MTSPADHAALELLSASLNASASPALRYSWRCAHGDSQYGDGRRRIFITGMAARVIARLATHRRSPSHKQPLCHYSYARHRRGAVFDRKTGGWLSPAAATSAESTPQTRLPVGNRDLRRQQKLLDVLGGCEIMASCTTGEPVADDERIGGRLVCRASGRPFGFSACA